MPEEPEVFKKLAEAEATPDLFVPFTGSYEMNQQIIEHMYCPPRSRTRRGQVVSNLLRQAENTFERFRRNGRTHLVKNFIFMSNPFRRSQA